MPIPFIIAGLVGAVAGGAIIANAVDDEMKSKDEEIKEKDKTLAKNDLRMEELKKHIESHREYADYIVALSALGIAMANADGQVSKEEVLIIRKFISGASSEKLPKYILEGVMKHFQNPPTLDKAIEIWSKCFTDTKELEKELKIALDFLECVMEADGEAHEREIAFLQAFKIKMQENYIERLENGR